MCKLVILTTTYKLGGLKQDELIIAHKSTGQLEASAVLLQAALGWACSCGLQSADGSTEHYFVQERLTHVAGGWLVPGNWFTASPATGVTHHPVSCGVPLT